MWFLCWIHMYCKVFFPPFFSLHFHFLKMSFEALKVLLWCHWNYQLLLTRLAFSYLCRFCNQPKIFVLPQGHEDVFLCFLQDIVSFNLWFRCTVCLFFLIWCNGRIEIIFMIQISSFPEHLLKRQSFHALNCIDVFSKIIWSYMWGYFELSILIHQSRCQCLCLYHNIL